MNKTIAFILIIAVLGGGYTAASWFYGKQTELVLGEQYDQALEKLPFIKIVERDYQRGLFASTETMTIEIKAPASAKAGRKTLAVDSRSLSLTIHNNIQHGPLPGFSTLAAVLVHSEIKIPDDVELSELKQLKGKSIFSQKMSVGFGGSGKATFRSPTINYSNQNPGKKLEFSWHGFSGDLGFAANMKQFSFSAQAPSMKISTDKGGKINISDIQFSGDRQKMFEDISSVYSGPLQLSVGEITVSNQKFADGPVAMKQLSYGVDVVKDGDFLNLAGRLGMEKIQIGKDAFGPFHYDASFKHFLARTFAEFSAKMMTLNTKLIDPDAHESISDEAVLPAFNKYAQSILDNDPEFHIDRISFATANGELNLKAKMKLNKKLKLEELMKNPEMLRANLEVDAELSLEENMIIELLRNPPKSYLVKLKGLSPEEQKAALEMQTQQFQQQVAMFTNMGYITREGTVLKSNAEFKTGQLLINGKVMPMGPSSAPAQNKQAPVEDESASKEMVN